MSRINKSAATGAKGIAESLAELRKQAPALDNIIQAFGPLVEGWREHPGNSGRLGTGSHCPFPIRYSSRKAFRCLAR